MNVMLVFLPAYSPEFNPIENLFSKIKHWMRANQAIVASMDTAYDCISMAMQAVTADDCDGWISHVDIYNVLTEHWTPMDLV